MSHLNKVLFSTLPCALATYKLTRLPNFQRLLHTSTNLSAKVPFLLSDIGEGIREVVVKEWYVQIGDKVSQFDNICEVQSDKASVTITSRYEGVISKLYYNIDDIALVGKPLVDVQTDDNADDVIAEPAAQQVHSEAIVDVIETKKEPQNEQNIHLCIPSVRRLAKEHNVDLSQIKGTGKNGRILKENVLEHLNKSTAAPRKQSADRIEPIKGFKKAMVKTMTESLKIPHFLYCDELKVTKLSELRNHLKAVPETKAIKLSFMPFFIKATSNALGRYPILNSSVDEKCENIYYKGAHNIGVAMDTKVGLAVPVIKNVQQLSIIEITHELNRLMLSGKNGSFTPDDLKDGTFSISNIGIIGGTYTKPVILPPQVAIFAIGAIQKLPRFDGEGEIIAEEIVNLSAAADHRVIDGATMANFVQAIKKQIENPNLLLLNI